MDQRVFKLPYGDEFVELNLAGIDILGVVGAPDVQADSPVTDQEQYQELIRALRQPIAHLPLADAMRGKRNIVIIVSDHTRPVPTPLLVRAIVAEGAQTGMKAENFSLVIGRGAHPGQNEDLQTYLPPELVGQVAVYESGQGGYKTIGRTDIGTSVEVDSRVAKAGFVIATGNIEMHRLAGFSGGAKAIMPGVCSRNSIQANHSLINQFQSKPGQISKNLIRQDIEQAANLCGVNYLLNVVIDDQKKILNAVAGDVSVAHRRGCAYARMYQDVIVSGQADVVVASAGGSPKDGSLYQGLKAMLNASELVKPGGHLIVYAQCPQGYGDHHFAKLLHQAQGLGQLKELLQQDFVLGHHKAHGLVKILGKCQLHIIAEHLPAVSWLRIHSSAHGQAVVRGIVGKFAPDQIPTGWVIPSAGYIFPKVLEVV